MSMSRLGQEDFGRYSSSGFQLPYRGSEIPARKSRKRELSPHWGSEIPARNWGGPNYHLIEVERFRHATEVDRIITLSR